MITIVKEKLKHSKLKDSAVLGADEEHSIRILRSFRLVFPDTYSTQLCTNTEDLPLVNKKKRFLSSVSTLHIIAYYQSCRSNEALDLKY